MTRTVAGISSADLEEATGRTWAGWFDYLGSRVSTSDHAAVVATVSHAGVENPWWQRTVARGYQAEHGDGVAADGAASRAVGVQRTVATDRSTLWRYLIDDGLDVWLGDPDGPFPVPDTAFRTTDGTAGEIRTVTDGHHLCLRWQPARLADAAVLQVALATPRDVDDRTTLRFHLEELPATHAREDLRTHWHAILDRIQADLED